MRGGCVGVVLTDDVHRFQHYERLADIQMLAMLSVIFCEPAARDGISNAVARIDALVRACTFTIVIDLTSPTGPSHRDASASLLT